MRLYPPAWGFGREALADCEIGGYAIPAGTTVIVSPWVSHRNPRYFEDPTAFRPERWDSDFAATLPRFAYIPFGGGPRICIGNRFAMMEAVLVLATVAQRFRLELQSDRPVVPHAVDHAPPEGRRLGQAGAAAVARGFTPPSTGSPCAPAPGTAPR